jgi:hypothetical protein
MRPIRDGLLIQLRQHADEDIPFIVQSVLIPQCDSRLWSNVAGAASRHLPDEMDVDG